MIFHTWSSLIFCLFLAAPPSSESFSQEIETHLHLYLHENFTEPNPTSVTVINPKNDVSSFGTIRVFANELREGSEPTSKIIGQSQGTGTSASRDEGSSLVEANFVFVDGEYRGSTLAVFGRPIRLMSSTWEVSIIGGTGQFRLARGYVMGKNLVVEPGQRIVVELELHFKHSCDRCCGFRACKDSERSHAGYCVREE